MSNPGLTVYFRGFAEEFPKEDLEALFAEHGTIAKFFVHKTGSYGMVEYEDLSSCTNAINNLHNKPPMNLYCNMAKVHPARNNPNMNNTNMNSNETRTPTVRFNYPNIDSVQLNYETIYLDENNTLINFLTDPQTNEIFVPIRYAPNIRKITRAVPVVPDGNYHGNGTMNDMDDAVSVVSVGSNRSRRVNLNNAAHDLTIERSFVEDDDDTANCSRKVIQKNNKTSYGNRFPRDHSQDGFSNKKDDQRTNNRRFNNTNTDEAKPRFSKKAPGGFGDNKNFNNHQRYPKRDFHKSKGSENGEADWGSTNADDVTPTPSTSRARMPVAHSSPAPMPVAQSSPAPMPVAHSSPAPVPVAQSSSTARIPNSFYNKLKPKTQIYYKSIELPKNQFTQVQIEHAVSETVGWAQISDKQSEFNDFMLRVIQNSDNPRPTKPEVGKICLAKYEGVLFRAVVLTVTPKLTVRFIDYGNESEVEDEILDINQEDLKVPAYAFHIQLADGAPCKVTNGATMKVKPVKYENDMVIVHVEHGIYDRVPEPPVLVLRAPVTRAPLANAPEVPEPCNSTAVTSTVSSTSLIKTSLSGCQETMISKLIVGMPGTMEVTIKLSPTKSVAFFLPEALGEDVALLEEISSSIENIDTPPYKPKVGDLVAAENEGWNRAVILKIESGFKVAFIDYGIIKTVLKVRPLPNTYKNVAQFSCVVQASVADFEKIDKIKELNFKIKNILNNVIHCTLSNIQGTDFYEATLSLWTPEESPKAPSRMMANFSSSSSSLDTVKQAPLTPPELKLKNGDDVKIVDQNKGFLFVRTKEGFDILKRVDKYIAEYAPKAANIQEKPVVGQYVASQFENVWYRALVTQVKQNSAEILYIDYGNDEIKPFFSLKHLDAHICKEPCSLIKIKLKGFVDKPFTKKCLDVFASLVENNQALKASFHGSCENGVDLTMKDGTTLTEKLLKLDVVALPKPNPFHLRKEFYMTVKVPGPNDERLMGITLEPIPFGKGEVIYLSDVDLASSAICVCVSKPDILHKVHVELLDQMTKYVTHISPKHPYRPVREEAVLVENRDKWYRAICLDWQEDIFTVFFVDYGFNMTVTADKIRAMPKEFVSEYNALGNFAIIHGLPETLDAKLIDRIETLLVKYANYEVEVLQKDEEENYTIHFPEILRKLRSEKLI